MTVSISRKWWWFLLTVFIITAIGVAVYLAPQKAGTIDPPELPSEPGVYRFATNTNVQCLTISPNGRLLAAAGNGGIIYVWDLTTIQPVAVLKGHKGYITTIVFTPDGKQLVSGGSEHVVRVWDTSAWSMAYVVEDFAASIHQIAVSPRGDALATADGTIMGMLKVIDFPSRQLRYGHRNNDLGVVCVVFSPDGARLAFQGFDGNKITICDSVTGKLLVELKTGARADYAQQLFFSPDGSRLYGTAVPGRLICFDTHSGNRLWTIQGSRNVTSSIALSPKGDLLVSCGDNDSHTTAIKFWRPSDHGLLATINRDSAGIRPLAFHPDGKSIVLNYEDSIELIDLRVFKQGKLLLGEACETAE